MSVETLDDLKLIKESARDFAENYIRPHVMEWDEKQHFPVELFDQMGEYGFLGVLVPEQYHGTGLGYQEYITVIEEIGKVCGGIGLSVAAHNSLCTNHILLFGNPNDPYVLSRELADTFLTQPLSDEAYGFLAEVLLDGTPDYEWNIEEMNAPLRLRGFLSYLFQLPEYQLT